MDDIKRRIEVYTTENPFHMNDAEVPLENGLCYKDESIRITAVPIKSRAGDADKIVMCYVCVLNKGRGRVSTEKIHELGIPYNRVNELIDNESILLEGRLVTINQIIEETDLKHPVVVIVECPSLNYIERVSTASSR